MRDEKEGRTKNKQGQTNMYIYMCVDLNAYGRKHDVHVHVHVCIHIVTLSAYAHAKH